MAQVERAAERDGFEVRLRWSMVRVVRVVALPLLVAIYLLYPWHGSKSHGGLVLGCLFLLLQLAFWWGQYRLWRAGALMVVNGAGITVKGEPTVPWRDLDRVVVVRRRVLAFHARWPDAELPLGTAGLRPRNPGRQRAQLVQRYGTPLVVSPSMCGLTVRDVVDAVRRYSAGLPVFD